VGGGGGVLRVLACADTGSEDPPWRAPVLVSYFCFNCFPHSPRKFCLGGLSPPQVTLGLVRLGLCVRRHGSKDPHFCARIFNT
jgi:hypothetical protein